MNGFKEARPDHLPIAASVWDTAQRYDTGGPTVIEALFEALVQLETELSRLKRANRDITGLAGT